MTVRALQGSTAYVIYSINPESTQAGALQQPLSIECRAYTSAYRNAMLMNGLLLQLCSGQVLQSATAIACMKEPCNDRRSAHAAVPAAPWYALHPQHSRRLQSGFSSAKACSDDSVDVCREPHAGLGLRHQRAVCAEQLPVLVSERNLRHPAHACRKSRHRRYLPPDSYTSLMHASRGGLCHQRTVQCVCNLSNYLSQSGALRIPLMHVAKAATRVLTLKL